MLQMKVKNFVYIYLFQIVHTVKIVTKRLFFIFVVDLFNNYW